MLTAAYLCNCMPHSGLDMETPFKRLYGKKFDKPYLKIVGARAFAHIKDVQKLEPKSWEEGCARSAKRKRFPTGSRTQRLAKW